MENSALTRANDVVAKRIAYFEASFAKAQRDYKNAVKAQDEASIAYYEAELQSINLVLNEIKAVANELREDEPTQEKPENFGGIQIGSKEFYEVMSSFEKTCNQYIQTGSQGFKREAKENWGKYYYADGYVDKCFKVFLVAYTLGKSNLIE